MRIARYTAWRLLLALPSLFVLTVLSFVVLRSAPGDPARVIAGAHASAATIRKLHVQLGLNDPIVIQYLRYLGRVAHGNLGMNLSGTAKVVDLISTGAVVTGGLVLMSVILMLAFSTPLALVAARRPGSAVDRVIRVGAVGGIAVPTFWVGVMLLTFVALPTGWFPIGGWDPAVTARIADLFLPSVSMALTFSPLVTRSLRTSAIEVLRADYVSGARLARIAPARLWTNYVLRNAITPTIPVISVVVGGIVGGSAIIETIFNLPGLGQLLVQAATTRDANLLQGVTLVIGTAVILIYLLADLVVALVDRRVKL